MGGGSKGRINIVWVKMEDVCKSNILVGLGAKNFRRVNLTLFNKWCWKLLKVEYALWKEIVFEMYGFLVVSLLQGVST